MSHGTRLYLFDRASNTVGVRKAGSTGPMRILRMPRCNIVRRTAMAFCSNHDKVIDNGKELMSVFRALASAVATTTAPYASLHWPMSRRRGKPVEPSVPNSWRLNRYLAHPIVRMMVSWGSESAKDAKYDRFFSEPSQPPITNTRLSSPEATAPRICKTTRYQKINCGSSFHNEVLFVMSSKQSMVRL